MRYEKLAKLYEELNSTTKRLVKIEILANFIKKINEKDKEVMYLLLGDIYPEYDERKIGISNQLAIKIISKATGTPNSNVLEEWKKLGDLGKVAEKLASKKMQSTLTPSRKLTIQKVLENLKKLPELEGKGTISKKVSLVTELLSSASPIESLYLIRTIIGDLRIGIRESTIREALCAAFFNKNKNCAAIIQDAIDKSNDISLVFEKARKKDIQNLKKINLKIGKPIKAMLAQKVKTIEEGFNAVGKPCAIEYKYDGFRLIIHKDKNKIMCFTRRLENVTKQFPEVEGYIKKYVKGKSFILDTEIVGYNPKTKKYAPFQAISQRIRRKYEIEKLKKELPIEINVFDILYYNGKSLLNVPFRKRTNLIKKIIKNNPYKIIHSKQIITGDLKKAKEFYKKSLRDNQEGIMMKNLDAKYQPGSRVGHMLKIKPDEKELDLVITGAEFGKGKRSGWLSSFILSCRGKKRGKYLEIGKVGTGIKEKKESGGVSFSQLTKLINPLIIKEKGKEISIKPKIVVTVHYQEIQRSPNYDSGWALRFPRIILLRPDKPLSEIANLDEIIKNFKSQKRNWY